MARNRGYVVASQATLVAVRILIASYFAASVGMLDVMPGAAFLSGVMPLDYARLASTAILFLTSFLIMLGRFVRPAALLLAVFAFWASFGTTFPGEFSPENLLAFWRDMALVGALLLIAATVPGGSRALNLRNRKAKPRRVRNLGLSGLTDSDDAPTPRPAAQVTAATPLVSFAPPSGDEDEDSNLFSDLKTA